MTNAKKPPGAPIDPMGYPTPNPPVSVGLERVLNGFERIEHARAANRIKPATRITRKQLALIGLARRQTGVSDDDFRQLLFMADGVESTKDLSPAGVDFVLRGLALIGFEHKRTAPQLGEREGMATPKQLHRIRQLWFRWLGRDDERALDRWLRKRYGVSAVRFATVEVAQKAIQGLIAMVDRKAAAGSGL